jgi:quercetin dioxygenase-like cupin family protein
MAGVEQGTPLLARDDGLAMLTNAALRPPVRANRSRKENLVTAKGNKVLIGPGEGMSLPILDVVHKVTAETSGGSLVIDTWGLPAGQMIPPHTHDREDECSFVLEGELTCFVGGEAVTAPAGSYVVKPRGIPHAFFNAGAETVRVMEILTPGASFEGYFDEYEEIASRDMGHEEHRKARSELGERYGITWHDEMIPDVESRFGIHR